MFLINGGRWFLIRVLGGTMASLILKAPSCVADCMAEWAEGNHSNVRCFMKFFFEKLYKFIKKQKLYIIENEIFFQSQKV